MFPFQKIFTLLIRTFSRPMLAYVKRKQIERPGSRFAGFFVGLGRRAQTLEHWVNHRILKTVKQRRLPELKEEVLLEKGIESFYQALFYLIVLGLPFWELYRSSNAAQKKEETLQKRIANLERKLTHLNDRANKIVEYAKDKSKQEQQAKQQRLKLAKDASIREQQQALKLEAEKERQEARARMAAMGETTPTQETDSFSEKVEEMFENAIEVMADEFEDSLDELQFGATGEDMDTIDEPSPNDSQIDSIDAEGEPETSDLLEEVSEIEADVEVEVEVEAEVGVEVEVDGDVQAEGV